MAWVYVFVAGIFEVIWVTGTRVPRIAGLPCWISGSMMIRSCMIGLVAVEESYDFVA